MTMPNRDEPVSPSDAIDELVSANKKSNATMLALVDEVRRETVARDRKIEVLEKNNRQTAYLIYMVGIVTIILLGLAIINAVNIAQANRQTGQLTAINATLLDCVNSTGNCGRANAMQQKEFLDEVKKYNLTGFYCIRNNPAGEDPEAQAFLRCMEQLYPGGPQLKFP